MDLQRIKKLQSHIVNSILLKKKENLFYLSGKYLDPREDGRYLLVKKNSTVFFGTGLEKDEGVGKADALFHLAKYLKPSETLEIFGGFTFGEAKYLRKIVKGTKLKITVDREPVDSLRLVKDANELLLIKKSMQIVERVFALVRKEIKLSGMTEIQLAQFIQKKGLQLGAEDISFPAIVASGANAAVPHHVPGNKKLKKGESIILDFGFKYQHYCSDFTRTVFLGTVPQKLKTAYLQTELAYNEAINLINLNLSGVSQTTSFREGARAADVHNKAVEVFARKKLEKYFVHSLGHGTGLEIHELPYIHSKSKDMLQNGMVFSIEPGLYFPNIGGIRIEDLVYIQNGKCEKFINVPTSLKENVF